MFSNEIDIGDIVKVVELNANRFAICIFDCLIRIYKINAPYDINPMKTLVLPNIMLNSIIYVKSKDVLISGSKNGILMIWSMKSYQCI